jgi:hypothetical protein
VWRPLNVLRRDPLGVCDGGSIEDGDLQEHMLHLGALDAKGKGESFAEGDSARVFGMWVAMQPKFPPPGNLNSETSDGRKVGQGHQWWYLSSMTPAEVLLIKCFDSKKDGRCRRAVHSAFEDSRYVGDEEPARESVEVRCAVFWEDQSVE